MRKLNKKTISTAVAIVVIFFFLLYMTPSIEKNTWVLQTAQKGTFIVAHNQDNAHYGDPMYAASKPIKLICEAKDGKLILTDKTNSKTYEGTYEVSSLGRRSGSKKTYTVFIDGKEGRASFSSRDIFNIAIDNYILLFSNE